MGRQTEKQHKRSGVLICGAYGMNNNGDEAVLEAIVREMRSIDAELPITVLSRTPAATAERYGVDSLHMFDLFGFLRVMRRSALYINGGGSLIQDVTSSRSLWYYLYTLAAAKHRGCRVMMYGCGIGPVSRAFDRRLSGFVIDRCVDEISLREENSLRELERFGVKRPHISVAGDPAITLTPVSGAELDEKMSDLGLAPDGNTIGFCLRNWRGFEDKAACFARAADECYFKRGLTPVFIAVNSSGDGSAAEKVTALMKAPFVCVSEPLSPALTAGILGRMRAVVSIRLHGLIFALSRCVPVAGVVYDPKVSAFLDYAQVENYLMLNDLTDEGLSQLIGTALAADRDALRAQYERLLDIERANLLAARRLLDKEEP